MASRYVPPHLRKKSGNGTIAPSDADNVLSTQVLARRRLSDLKVSQTPDRPLHTLAELNHHFGSSLVHSTLRDTSKKPGTLGFVVLFRGANPRWRTDSIIFAHTNINILPGYTTFKQQIQNDQVDGKGDTSDDVKTMNETKHDGNAVDQTSNTMANLHLDEAQPQTLESAGTPKDATVLSHHTDAIPIFMEISGQGGPRKFVFHGYFHLARVEFLKPQSPELVRMLQQKWQPAQRNSNIPPSQSKTRDAAAWSNSLSQEWAIVQFEAVPKDQSPEDPIVEILPDRPKDLLVDGSDNTGILEKASGDRQGTHEAYET